LRVIFLVPLAVAIVLVVGAFVLEFYRHQHGDVEEGVVRIRASAAELYRDSISHNGKALGMAMEMLERDRVLRMALARGDRDALLAHSVPIFKLLNHEIGITHFYFTRPDRINLLRVHQPHRHGDKIDRVTTLEAQRSGTASVGVELGALGTFTLRLVDPWYDDRHRLIGFVELGMEIDGALEALRDIMGMQVYVLIDKKFIKRESWESGMRTLGRTPQWDLFPDAVVSAQSTDEVSPELAEAIRRVTAGKLHAAMDLMKSNYHFISVPLLDAGRRKVGNILLRVDVSHEVDAAREAVISGSVLALLAGGALFVFFYWLVGEIGRRLESDERALEDMAMHDGLTGLLNHRVFYSDLEREAERAGRYGATFSLLMLDIDHFKRVNDTYGHVAGDLVLTGLSQVVVGQVRKVDSVYRYGGEEMAVILPDTGEDAATGMAERIRTAVEQHRFDIGEGQPPLQVTVSIGVATFFRGSAAAHGLVEAADEGLYRAKEGGRNRVCRHGA
jgi:diguanylate cyclase (GGDEF)-like protein